MKVNYFASNATNCFTNTLNLIQYDIELLVIKLMYGNLKNNMLNSTLFLKNVSDLNYICLDAGENNYVFWVYKMDSFGRDATQITLGWLQNVLANVLRINNLVQKAVEYNDNNETEKMMYILGQISYIMLDFEPIVLDDAGFGKNVDIDGEIYLQDGIFENSLDVQSQDSSRIKEWYAQRYGENETFATHANRMNRSGLHGPLVKQDWTTWFGGGEPSISSQENPNADTTITDDGSSFNLNFFESNGGLFGDTLPGLRHLLTLSGPSNLVRGFINGS